MNHSLASFVHAGVVLCVFVFLLFLSLSSLTESPATWMDEGAINQVAMNLSEQGI